MSLFEVDVDAAHMLMSDLNQTDQVLGTLLSALTSANSAFDPTFVSPDKGKFEQNFQVILNNLHQAQIKSEEIRTGLNNLLSYIQQGEQIAF